MSEKKVTIQHDASFAKVKFNDYASLMSISKKELNINGEFHLEYEKDGKWIAILDDDDIEDLTDDSKLRVVIKSIDKKLMGPGSNYASHGAAAYHGNAQYVGGNVSGKMVGRDYIEGDILTDANMAKAGTLKGNMHTGGSQIDPADPFTDDSDDDKKKH